MKGSNVHLPFSLISSIDHPLPLLPFSKALILLSLYLCSSIPAVYNQTKGRIVRRQRVRGKRDWNICSIKMTTDDREDVSAPPFTPLLNSCNIVTSQNQKSCYLKGPSQELCICFSEKIFINRRGRQKFVEIDWIILMFIIFFIQIYILCNLRVHLLLKYLNTCLYWNLGS